MNIGLNSVMSVSRRAYLTLLMLSLAFLALSNPAWGQSGKIRGIGGSGVKPETGGIGGTSIHSKDGIGGTGLPIVGYGPIQAFGSVFVNGREYEFGRTTRVTVNGKPASLSDLHVGDLAKVQGVTTTKGHGIAQQIAISYPISGPVSAIANDRNSFVVVRQRIILVNPDMIAGLKVGQDVRVSAQKRPDGTWVAYRVAPYPRQASFRIEGRVIAIKSHSLRVSQINMAVKALLLAGIHLGERVIVTGKIYAQGFEATHVAPSPLVLGPTGMHVELFDYFRSAGHGRLVSADGLTAQGAPETVNFHKAEPIQISGYLSKHGTVQIERLEIATPASVTSHPGLKPRHPVAQEGKRPEIEKQSEHRRNGSEAGEQRADPAENQAAKTGISTVENPESGSSEFDTTTVDTTSFDTPTVDTPTVDTPTVDTPTVDTPTVDTTDN